MKNIYFIYILISYSTFSFSQPILDWEFNSTAAYNYYPTTNIIHTDHGTYVSSQSIDVNESAYIFRLDETGNIINQDSIQHFTYSILGTKRMVIDTDGSIYICGRIVDPLQHGKVRVIKYDSLLNKLWDTVLMDSLTNDYSIYGILYSKTENNIYVITDKYDGIDKLAIIKLETNENVLWESIDTVHNRISLVTYVLDNTGNVILGGYGSSSGNGEDFIISKIDTSGQVAWYINEDGSNHSDDAVMDLCIDNSNNISAIGRFNDTLPNKVLKFNPTGNKIWTRSINDIFLPKITSDAADGIYITGFDSVAEHECVIYKFDSTGNYSASNYSNIPNHTAYTSDYLVSIQTDDSANVYILNNVDSIQNKKWFVAKFDSSLNLKWSFIYPENIPNPSTSSSLCLFDGGFTIAGAINNFGQLRVLQFHESFPTIIQETESTHSFTCWPNPTSNIIFINMGDEDLKNSEFKLYDIQSRLLYQDIIRSDDKNMFNFDLSLFPAGIYLINLKSENQNLNFKVVKEN